MMMHSLRTCFKRERNQQTKGDRAHMHKKVAPAVYAVFWWMHFHSAGGQQGIC